jgi:hypothetical protein
MQEFPYNTNFNKIRPVCQGLNRTAILVLSKRLSSGTLSLWLTPGRSMSVHLQAEI